MSNHEKPECPESHAFKIVVGAMSSVMLLMIALFINAAWAEARRGTSLEPRVVALETNQQTISAKLEYIQKGVDKILQRP